MSEQNRFENLIWRNARAAASHVALALSFFTICAAGGFFLFTQHVMQMQAVALRYADGIVALTGDDDRIPNALRLLSQGKGRRLLISGVNKSTTTPELVTLNAGSWRETLFFYCCVDVGREALNTEDNAAETTAWVKRQGFKSLIVVTSTYHMPRTLVELRQAMPGIELLPYPVKPTRLDHRWWADPGTSWLLGKEYIKFGVALARSFAHTLFEGRPKESPTRLVNARMG